MTECIICGTEHTELYGSDPHRYCSSCNTLKHSLKGVASGIIVGKFDGSICLGDAESAKHFKGKIICVHENPEYCVEGALHLPILEKPPKDAIDRTGAVASLSKLKHVSQVLTNYTLGRNNILIHCAGGVERSPLALAFHLSNIRFTQTIEGAYQYIIERRAIVSRRLYWLEEGVA